MCKKTKIKPRFLLVFLFMLAMPHIWAQPERFTEDGDEEEQEEKSESNSSSKGEKAADSTRQWYQNLIFGGNVGLSLGNVTYVNVVGQIGYPITENWVGGAGFNYSYYAVDQLLDPNGNLRNVDFSTQIYGPNVFTNFFPFEQAFIGAQGEYLNHDHTFFTSSGASRESNRWTPVLWLQAGYRQSFGRKGGYLLGLRANLLHDQYSPYGNWWMPYIGVFF